MVAFMLRGPAGEPHSVRVRARVSRRGGRGPAQWELTFSMGERKSISVSFGCADRQVAATFPAGRQAMRSTDELAAFVREGGGGEEFKRLAEALQEYEWGEGGAADRALHRSVCERALHTKDRAERSRATKAHAANAARRHRRTRAASHGHRCS